ncbi:thioesterase family protein [uncultured Sunxiuqinia sp.]|uniref:acyl-CoA thioesterase n=1 Tax=uncultured Sunxiuqinia sp. TaxID=1573825 RepID=UPI002AA6C110|nr:thioesterase family protein [uncultured Sunxiuqinia sp.]
MKKLIENTIQLRPRYGEVDQMGYVYHASYVSYCHQARTELLRELNIDDKTLEENYIMLPVISMNLKYHKPAGYDELLTIKTSIPEMPATRFSFHFEIRNEHDELICSADSTTVFVNSTSRKPMKAPPIIIEAIGKQHKTQQNEAYHTH